MGDKPNMKVIMCFKLNYNDLTAVEEVVQRYEEVTKN